MELQTLAESPSTPVPALAHLEAALGGALCRDLPAVPGAALLSELWGLKHVTKTYQAGVF